MEGSCSQPGCCPQLTLTERLPMTPSRASVLVTVQRSEALQSVNPTVPDSDLAAILSCCAWSGAQALVVEASRLAGRNSAC